MRDQAGGQEGIGGACQRSSRPTPERLLIKNGGQARSACLSSGGVELAPLRSLATPCTENWAGALPAEATSGTLPAGRETKMGIPVKDFYRYLNAGEYAKGA
jgi:hypothetical protein